jgi:hypothetical protein
MLLSDFHVHTNWSDGKHSIAEIIDIYGSRGFGVIAITDHVCETKSFMGVAAHWLNRSLTKERFKDYIQMIEQESARAWKQYRMLVLPGVEITKNALRSQKSAHILGLGVRTWIDPDQEISLILKDIRAQGGVTVAAHPVFTLDPSYIPTLQLWRDRQSLSELVDAWEVASGHTLFDEVFKSGLPMLANSDLHHVKQIRSWKTMIDCRKTENAVLRSIKSQDVSFTFYEGSQTNQSLALASVFNSTAAVRSRTRLREYNFS